MKRKIEFRGKHIHVMPWNKHLDNTWVYGFLEAENYISVEYEDGSVGEKLVDGNTVGQFTGKHDRNNQKIFEWDIVEIKRPHHGKKYWLVIYEDAEFRLTDKFPDTYDRITISNYDLCWNDVKVIGNYTDNPELLRKNAK